MGTGKSPIGAHIAPPETSFVLISPRNASHIPTPKLVALLFNLQLQPRSSSIHYTVRGDDHSPSALTPTIPHSTTFNKRSDHLLTETQMSSRRLTAVPPLAPAPPPPSTSSESGATVATAGPQSQPPHVQVQHPPTRKNKHATDQELHAIQVILQQERDRIRLGGGGSSSSGMGGLTYSSIHPTVDLTLPSPGLSPAMGAMSLRYPTQSPPGLGPNAITQQSLAQGWHAAAVMMGSTSAHHPPFPSPPSVSPSSELVSASGGSYFDSRAAQTYTTSPPQAQYANWHVQPQGAPQIHTLGLGRGPQVGSDAVSTAADAPSLGSFQHTTTSNHPLSPPEAPKSGGDRDLPQVSHGQQQPDRQQMKAGMKNNGGDLHFDPTPTANVSSDLQPLTRQHRQACDPSYDLSSPFQTYNPPPPPPPVAPPAAPVPNVRSSPDSHTQVLTPTTGTNSNSESASSGNGNPTPDLQQSAHDFHRNHHNHLSIKSSRTILTPLQTCVLRRVLATTVFPSTQLRMILARELGLSPRTVQIWFQNRRQKMKLLEKQKANGASTDHDAANKSASGMFLEVKNDADLVAEAIASSTAASDMVQPPPSPCTSSLPPMPHYNHQEAGYFQPHAPPVSLISPPPTASSHSSSYGSGGSFPPLSATSSSFPTPTTSSSHSSTLHSPRYHPYQFPSSASSSSSAYPTPTSYSSSSSSSYMDSRALDYMQARSATFPHSSSGSSGSYSYLSSSAPVAVASPMHLPTSSPLYSPIFLGTSAHQQQPFPPASLVSPRFGASPPGVDRRSHTPAPNLRPILSRTLTSSSSATCASSTPTVSPYAASSSIGPPVPLEPSTTQGVTRHAPGAAPPSARLSDSLAGRTRRKPPPAPITVPAATSYFTTPVYPARALDAAAPQVTRETPRVTATARATALELLASAAATAAAAADRAALSDQDDGDLMMGAWEQDHLEGGGDESGAGSPSDVALRAIRGRGRGSGHVGRGA